MDSCAGRGLTVIGSMGIPTRSNAARTARGARCFCAMLALPTCFTFAAGDGETMIDRESAATENRWRRRMLRSAEVSVSPHFQPDRNPDSRAQTAITRDRSEVDHIDNPRRSDAGAGSSRSPRATRASSRRLMRRASVDGSDVPRRPSESRRCAGSWDEASSRSIGWLARCSAPCGQCASASNADLKSPRGRRTSGLTRVLGRRRGPHTLAQEVSRC